MNSRPGGVEISSLRRRIEALRKRLTPGSGARPVTDRPLGEMALDVDEVIDPASASSDHFCDHFLTLSGFGEDLLFLDLETTGLGAGARIFLAGVLHREGDRFRLRQWYCQDVVEEGQVLRKILAAIEERPTVVTYNGDAFDLPFIERRLRWHGIGRICEGIRSIDLLPLVRKRYRDRWPDCRLVSAEEHL
ncbi:MAG TPA: hypothetical protein EYN79_06625, partial [Planctomycetes bacterium]|nr:hypothetical protein [Planctomycetota bacterium]